ncbi:MAG: helix-turn-helix transcriptional regulator [Acidobacteriota bacterium]
MKPPRNIRFGNRLAEIRKEQRFPRKRVAALLGHRNIDRLSLYEVGLRIPNLKTALKLAKIYGIPIRVALDEYYEACVSEVREQEKQHPKPRSTNLPKNVHSDFEFCTFEQKLSSPVVGEDEIVQIRRHTALLIRTMAEKMGHV